MAEVKLEHICKYYNKQARAVEDFSLHIEDGSFIVIVGPSGCGKSTLLRIIAGLEMADFGNLYIDGKLINQLEPEKRGIGMIFQKPALFPRMRVHDNIAIGLRKQGLSQAEIDEKVCNAARLCYVDNLLHRYPHELSGGEQQRVALARAITHEAELYLMDEPLSSLDAQLRVVMRTQIRSLHNRLRATTIFVTHDQVEAMTLADYIVVMKDGQIQQVGTPQQIYADPQTVFVGGFINDPPMNFLTFTLHNGKLIGNGVEWTIQDVGKLKAYENKQIIVGFRPENIYMAKKNEGNTLHIQVSLCEQRGDVQIVYANMADEQIACRFPSLPLLALQDELDVAIDEQHLHFFDAQTSCRIG